jgi:hypothetical protein
VVSLLENDPDCDNGALSERDEGEDPAVLAPVPASGERGDVPSPANPPGHREEIVEIGSDNEGEDEGMSDVEAGGGKGGDERPSDGEMGGGEGGGEGIIDAETASGEGEEVVAMVEDDPEVSRGMCGDARGLSHNAG